MVSSVKSSQIKLNNIIDSLQDETNYKKNKFSADLNENLKFNEELELKENDGYIESRNGELFVRNPKNNGRFPTLIPHPTIRIFVNNHLIKKETVVTERDMISWLPKNEEDFSILISKDKLKVYLKLHENILISYRLKNKKRSLKFIFELEGIEKTIDIEEMSSKIIDEIYKKGIKCEINMSSILTELKSPTFKSVIVAEGLPVIESRDAFIETNFPSKLEISLEEVNGKIDYKNIVKIPNVKAGEVIATVHKPLEGQDGLNVYGKVLKTKPPKKIEIRTKSRTELKEDGRVVALQAGRPTVTGNSVKYFDILQVHEIHGDVDLKTGNILFNGDVIVHGNVKDHMRVDALGNIYIKGSVYLSTIVSAQNIYIEGAAINSKIFAGQHGILLNQVYKLLQNLLFMFNQLTAVLDQVMKKVEKEKLNYSVGKVAATLIDQKYKEYTIILDQFFKLINEAEQNKTKLPMSIQILTKLLTTIKNREQLYEIDHPNIFENIKFSLKDIIFQAESTILPDSEIYVKEADASEIKANGCVNITEKGAINSKIFAGDRVIFQKKDSVIRGGTIDAVKKIIAGEVGSPTGRAPELNAGEQIEIKKLNHAKIKIQNDTKILFDPKKNVVYSLEAETQKIISYTVDDSGEN